MLNGGHMKSYVHSSNLISEVTSNQNLKSAFSFICKARNNEHHNSDIWSVRRNWREVRTKIRNTLQNGQYQLSPVALFRCKTTGRYLTRWSSVDAIVLQAISFVISKIVGEQTDLRCTHIKGNGGLKGATTMVNDSLRQQAYRFVIKSDVANFYDSMDHQRVMDCCKTVIKDKKIQTIIAQYLNRVEVINAKHNLVEKGIAMGCPLSPLMGALILKSLDKMLGLYYFYVRYMDDWVILTRTRQQCRRLVKKMHEIMHRLKFKLAIDKTYIGKIENGFDFLGYRFNHKGIVGLAKKTIHNFISRLRVLYEQNATDLRIAQYVRRWMRCFC